MTADSPIAPEVRDDGRSIVPRPRLVERLAAHPVGLVRAPAGAGKTVLLRQCADAFDGPAVVARLTRAAATPDGLLWALAVAARDSSLADLATVLEVSGADLATVLVDIVTRAGDPMLFIVDDVHLAGDDLAHSLGVIVRQWPAPHRLLLAGRHLPDAVPVTPTTPVVDGGEMAFSADESRALLDGLVVDELIDRVDVQAVVDATNGWAGALLLARNRLQVAAAADPSGVDRELLRLTTESATTGVLLDGLLGRVDDRVSTALCQLARLPTFDDTLAVRAGLAAGVRDAYDAGIPIEQDGPWHRIPDSLREDLATRGVPDASFLRDAADHLATEGHAFEALRTLVDLGLPREAAATFERLSLDDLMTLPRSEHAKLVAALDDDVLRDHPAVLLTLADDHLLSGDVDAFRLALERAGAVVVGAPDEVRHEVECAVLAMGTLLADDDRDLEELQRVSGTAGLTPRTRARVDVGLGRCFANQKRVDGLRAAVQHYERGVAALERLDDAALLTRVLVQLAMGPEWMLGRLPSALAHLDRALDLADVRLRTRVSVLPYKAFVLVAMGEYTRAEGVLAELRRTAALVHDDRSAAYARWAMARMASQRGDRSTTAAHCSALLAAAAPLDIVGGAYVHADMAQVLARVGDLDGARRLAKMARSLDVGTTYLTAVAELVVAAHDGDPEGVAQCLAVLDGGAAVPPLDRWRVTLLHAWALHQCGDEAAAVMAASAFEQAAQLGLADLPVVHESRITGELVALAAPLSPAAAELDTTPAVVLELFGGVVVRRADGHQRLSGRPAELLARLGLHGRVEPVEALIEAMWPGVAVATGRQRLRTVLARTRRAVGDLVERTEGSLHLRGHVEVDVEDFLRLERDARASADGGADAARAALTLFQEHLAPDLSYHPWVESAQRDLTRRALGLLDRLAADARARGRVDDAVQFDFDAIALDPSGEGRYLAVARSLAAQGWRARAAGVLDRYREHATATDLPVSPEVEQLRQGLLRTDMV